jgi:hypothetical protein
MVLTGNYDGTNGINKSDKSLERHLE